MWITLIITILSYLLQNPQNSKERKQALVGALAAGAITYGVTEYTDWGQANLAPLNDSIGNFFTGGPTPGNSPGTTVGAGSSSGGSGSGGLWSALQGLGPAGIAAIGGAVGLATNSGWLIPALAVGGAILLLK